MESPLRTAQFLGSRLSIALHQNHYIQSVVKSLRKGSACLSGGLCDDRHRDIRHSNWIETEGGLIYLVGGTLFVDRPDVGWRIS